MEYLVHRIFLDMHSVSSQVMFRVKQGTTKRKVYITLREGGQPYQIAKDCTAKLSAKKPDGNPIWNNCEIVGNAIVYTFTEQTTAALGVMDCEVILYDWQGEQIASPHFTIIVEQGVFYGDEIISTPEANALNGLIDRATAAAESAENVVGDIKSYANDNFANALNGTAEGEFVQVDDISPIEHTVECRTTGKNLWNMSALTSTDKFTVNEDGTVTIKANNYACATNNRLYQLCPSLKAGDVVTFSIETEGKPHIYLYQEDLLVNNGDTITITEKMLSSVINLYGAYINDADYAESHRIQYIQIEKGTEVTDYAPYVDPSMVKVTRCGKNLIPFPYYQSTSTANGGTITVGDDGGISFSGTPTGYVGLPIYKGKAFVKSGEFTLSNKGTAKNYVAILYLYDADGETVDTKSTTGAALTLNMDDYPTVTDWNITYSRAISNTEISGTIYPMLELGSVDTEYEPFNESQTYTVNADGTVEGVTSLYPTMVLFANSANTFVSCKYTRDSNKVIKGLYEYIEELTSNVARISSVKILASAWVTKDGYYEQKVSVPGATVNSQVDLTPSVEQLAIFHEKDLAFVTENVNGEIFVYAVGQKPTNDYTIQVTLTEVNV